MNFSVALEPDGILDRICIPGPTGGDVPNGLRGGAWPCDMTIGVGLLAGEGGENTECNAGDIDLFGLGLGEYGMGLEMVRGR